MFSNKHTPTRTYARSLKKDEGASTFGLGHGEIPIEYETACRLCLNKTDIMSEIFGDLDSIVSITEKMKNVLGVEVYEEDRLPTLICENCLHQLNDAYNFKKRCLASYVKLRQYLCTPLKSLTYSEKTNEDEGKESDTNSYSEENFYSLKHVKEECTIGWDDQVPLAAIISSATPEISNNNLTEPPVVENILNDTGTPGNNWNQFAYVDYEKAIDETQGVHQIGMEPEKGVPIKKTVQVIEATGYCKIKTQTHDQKPFDLDDVPLSLRMKMENKHNAQFLKRSNKSKQNQEEIPPSSENELESGVSDKPKEEITTRMFRSMHVCTACSKVFPTPSLLARHFRVHTGEKPFRCDMCVSAFSQKEMLQRHKAQLHNENKPHICKYCDKAYGTYSILAVHIRTAHVRYGQYKCKLCAKVFRHASGLSRHQNLHNGTFFYCKVCGKHFNDGSSVKRHTKVHKDF